MSKIVITAALPYANGPLHLGHLAGAYLPSDIYARFKRLQEREVLFVCGSDEHGVPITLAAQKENTTPQLIVDRYHELNKKTFENMGIDFDFYGRTSSKTHHEHASNFFLTLLEKGIFKKKSEEQLFDPKMEMFLPDRYVKGTCPNCGFEEAYGDQCEKCGTSLSAGALINPKSMLSDADPIMKTTEHWFLPLGEFEPWLREWMNSNTDWKSNVVGQCMSWIDSGLSDRAVTRDLSWGVKVPVDGTDGKVLYVWFDAPIGYISASIEWAVQKGNPDLWKDYWCNSETELYHFIGKDNIVFHCIMFPAMLKAHGEYVLPKNVPANEFLNLEGKKLSTSRNWAVWLHEYLAEFDVDYLRYVICSTLPETKDSDFSWTDYQTRVNSELADILGNFLFRAVSFGNRFFEGVLPSLSNPSQIDLLTLDEISNQKFKIESNLEKFQFRQGLFELIHLARIGNRYFTEKAPWHSRKTNLEDCANTIHVSLQIAAALAYLMEPFMPAKSALLKKQLHLKDVSWSKINSSIINVGDSFGDAEILFSKIEDDKIQAQLDKLKMPQENEEIEQEFEFESLSAQIQFEDFLKPDIRVGKIIASEAVPKSKKLLKNTVDLGFETRTILSGIAQYYSPEDIIGEHVLVVANLAPRVMMGIESQGMILMATNPDNTLSLVTSKGQPGSKIS